MNNTIDLAWIHAKERNEWLIKNWYRKPPINYKNIAINLACALFLLLLGIIMPIWKTEAYNLTIQDKIRLERLEVCQIAIKKADIASNQLELQDLVIKCALRMTGVYVVESRTWKEEIRKNNFLWLKRTVNWYYWFNSFKSWYDCRLYFARKYAEFHYKKSARTFVYWFWIDNKWQYGWSTTDKESYTQTLYKIENDTETKIQYKYLYFTN